MTLEQVGAWIKAELRRRKLSVGRVHELSGISRTTIYDLIAGKHPPSVDTQAGIAAALRVKPDWYDRLMAGESPVFEDETTTDEMADEIDSTLARRFFAAGPASIPDSLLYDDAWVQQRSTEVFAVLMMERRIRDLISQLPEQFATAQAAEKGLDIVEDLRERVARLEAAAARPRRNRSTGEAS